MNEDKASRYHRLKRRAAVVSAVLTAAVLGGLLLSGASHAMRDIAVAIGGERARFSPAAVAVYVLLLAAAQEVVAFPLTFYRSFLLERRYGLSSESLQTWIRDHVKAMALALILGLSAAEVVYAAMARLPGGWWAVCAVVFMAATAVMASAAPVVLLPIFYKFTPLSRESLRGRLVELSARAGVPVLGVYEWGLGEKTTRANAALVGTGATRRIIVSDTLLSQYSEDEIEVILAHELGHHVHRDILAALLVEFVLLLGGFYAASLALRSLWPAVGLSSPADVAGLPLLLLAGGVVTTLAAPVINALSRRNERRADRYALEITRKPAAFVTAMRRLASQNLAEEYPSRVVQMLFHTHPSIEQRIEAARRFTT